MTANLETDSDAVAIVLTDAEIGSHQMDELVNKANSQDVKFVFVAITPSTNTQKCNAFQEVFGDNVITSHEESDVIDCITRVMLDWD
jgi:ABC-type Zn uptake system ZnuABC Zn-binding protein ZnuA